MSMSIHELAARSGLPERRIRYYIAEGLVPPPCGRGRAARYGPEHLERLRRIHALRAERLGLDEIRQRLEAEHQHRRAGETSSTLWRHWVLGRGVVLMAQGDLPETELQRVEALVTVSRQLLGGHERD